MEQPGYKPTAIWVANSAGSRFAHYVTMLVPECNLEIIYEILCSSSQIVKAQSDHTALGESICE